MIPQTNDNHPNITSDTTEPEPEPLTDHDIPYCSEFIPPESFWLSKDSEFDWFDRNAFLERKESTKGNSNNSKSSNNGPTSYSRSNSQKFSVNLKSKPAIIGLPKTQRNTHVDSNRRQCRPVQAVRMFPKRSGSSGRTTVTEPTSPKVSCIGRVRSKRCPNRRRSNTQPVKERKPVVQEKKEKTGIISRITSLFRSDGSSRRKGNNNNSKSGKVNEQVENLYSRKNSVKPVNSEPASPPEAPALGGMNRFASGRRSVTWTDDIDVAGRRS